MPRVAKKYATKMPKVLARYAGVWHNLGMTLDGDKVRRFLQTENKSKEWLATQLNCSLKTVENVLGGKVPRGSTLVALACLMGCQVEALIPKEAKRAAG